MHAFRSNDGSYFLRIAWAERDGAQEQVTLFIDGKDAWQLPILVLNTDPSHVHAANATLAFTSGKATGTGPRLCVALPPGYIIRSGERVVCTIGPGAARVLPLCTRYVMGSEHCM